MTKKEIRDHKKVITQMDWDDLAISIMEIEMEICELEEYMSEKELSKHRKLLELYEIEKWKRVEEESYGSSNYGMTYGEDFVSNWNIEGYEE
jgi:ribosome-binding protein aMBF1 (putative translation factor)